MQWTRLSSSSSSGSSCDSCRWVYLSWLPTSSSSSAPASSHCSSPGSSPCSLPLTPAFALLVALLLAAQSQRRTSGLSSQQHTLLKSPYEGCGHPVGLWRQRWAEYWKCSRSTITPIKNESSRCKEVLFWILLHRTHSIVVVLFICRDRAALTHTGRLWEQGPRDPLQHQRWVEYWKSSKSPTTPIENDSSQNKTVSG